MLRRTRTAFAELAPTGTLVRGYRVDQVLSAITPVDYVYAMQSAPQLFTFISRRDSDSIQLATEILKIDERDRCIHAVFGRQKVPVDFFADIEFPTYDAAIANEKARQKMLGNSPAGAAAAAATRQGRLASGQAYTGEEIVMDVIKASHDLLQERFKVKPQVTALFDGGATQEKHSYHLHMRIADAAFADYSVLHDIHSEVNFAVGLQAIDLSCTRPYGMLRLAFTPKFTDRARVLRPIEAKDSELARMCSSMKDLSQTELMAMSLVTRTDELRRQDPDFKLLTAAASGNGGGRRGGGGSRSSRGGGGGGPKEYDSSGREISPHLEESKKPMRFKEACARVHSFPMHIADDYNTWVRVGLALHAFGPDPAAYQHWLTFSSKSPSKFDPHTCEKYWEIFAKRPDCYNWRRGHTYIMKSLSGIAKGRARASSSSSSSSASSGVGGRKTAKRF